jgi:hypothetical protein
MLGFVRADAKGALRTALRAFVWTTSGVGLALFAAVLLNPRRTEALTAASVIATLLVALVYAALPGIVAATGAALFRLAGAWAVLPLVVFPLIVLAAFSLGRGVLAGQAQDVLSALGAELKSNTAVLGAIPVHGGTFETLIAVLLIWALYSALQPVVLLQLFQYLLLVGGLIGIALLLTCTITFPPLLFAVVRRARLRYAEHVARGEAPMTRLAIQPASASESAGPSGGSVRTPSTRSIASACESALSFAAIIR